MKLNKALWIKLMGGTMKKENSEKYKGCCWVAVAAAVAAAAAAVAAAGKLFLYPCILVSLYPCILVFLYSCILVSLY